LFILFYRVAWKFIINQRPFVPFDIFSSTGACCLIVFEIMLDAGSKTKKRWSFSGRLAGCWSAFGQSHNYVVLFAPQQRSEVMMDGR
jgi:hypothetical protein